MAACASAWKSTWLVRSASPGWASGGSYFMHAHRLQRIAEAGDQVPVVDGASAVPHTPSADLQMATITDWRAGEISNRVPAGTDCALFGPGQKAGSMPATPTPKASSPSASRPTMRSRKPVVGLHELTDRGWHRRVRWPRSSEKPGGTSSKPCVPADLAAIRSASVSCWMSRRRWLVSTRCAVMSSKSGGAMREMTRSMSDIMVPRPGPISTRRTPAGVPWRCQAWTMKTPIISPKSWLTSGAVTKSPERPNGLAGSVVAVFGIGEAQRKEIGDADRAVRLDDRLDLLTECGGHAPPPVSRDQCCRAA